MPRAIVTVRRNGFRIAARAPVFTAVMQGFSGPGPAESSTRGSFRGRLCLHLQCFLQMARQRVELGRDPGLQFRMLLTLFLLGLLYVALIGVLFAAGASAVIILVVAGGLALGQLFLSDKI